MTRLAAVPAPAPVDAAEAPERLDTIVEFAGVLHASRAQIERLVGEGLPVIDLSIPRPGRRHKRCLRFDRTACLAWLRQRGKV